MINISKMMYLLLALFVYRCSGNTFSSTTGQSQFLCHCVDVNEQCSDRTGECTASGCDDETLSWAPWSGPGCQIGNVAYGKPGVRQGNTYQGKTADMLVNGRISSVWEDGEYNWSKGGWFLDLGGVHVVQKIVIYTVTGKFNAVAATIEVHLSMSNVYRDSDLCTDEFKHAARLELIVRCSNRLGRYIRIQRVRWVTFLASEVLVQGYQFHECQGLYGDDYYYGPGCLLNCHCDEQCDPITGVCPASCKPGYSGDHCQSCDEEHWGPDCTAECHCSVDCDSLTGYCSDSCDEGYDGYNCQQCDADYWGPDCTYQCDCPIPCAQCYQQTFLPFCSIPLFSTGQPDSIINQTCTIQDTIDSRVMTCSHSCLEESTNDEPGIPYRCDLDGSSVMSPQYPNCMKPSTTDIPILTEASSQTAVTSQIKPNPLVESLYPLQAVIQGGTNLTVTGDNFAGIQNPQLLTHVEQQQSNSSSLFRTPCHTENTTLMRCVTADISAVSTSRSRELQGDAEQAQYTVHDLDIYLGLSFDDLQTYRDLRRTDLVAYSRLTYVPDIQVNTIADNPATVKVWWPHQLRSIGVDGEFNKVDLLTDQVFVTVGSRRVNKNNVSITDNHMDFIPPDKEPGSKNSANDQDGAEEGSHLVLIHIGNQKLAAGELVYENTILDCVWCTAALFSSLLAFVLLMLGTIVVLKLCRKRNVKLEKPAAKERSEAAQQDTAAYDEIPYYIEDGYSSLEPTPDRKEKVDNGKQTGKNNNVNTYTSLTDSSHGSTRFGDSMEMSNNRKDCADNQNEKPRENLYDNLMFTGRN